MSRVSLVKFAPFHDGHRFTERAELAYSQMLWYAWGRMDANGSTEQNPHGVSDGFRVAGLYRESYERFVLEQTFYAESIMGFYESHAYALTVAA